MAIYHTNSKEYPPKNREVHHNNEQCPEGKKIRPEHREYGNGGKPLCKECQTAVDEAPDGVGGQKEC